jgi:hypothetical protein
MNEYALPRPDGAVDDDDAIKYVSVDPSAISVFPKSISFDTLTAFAVVGTTLLLERPMEEIKKIPVPIVLRDCMLTTIMNRDVGV